MKQLLVGLSLILGVFFIAPAPVAQAWSFSSWFSKDSDGGTRYKRSWKRKGGDYSYKRERTRSVPELDPSAAGGAIVLLLGGGAYVLSRRREEDLA